MSRSPNSSAPASARPRGMSSLSAAIAPTSRVAARANRRPAPQSGSSSRLLNRIPTALPPINTAIAAKTVISTPSRGRCMTARYTRLAGSPLRRRGRDRRRGHDERPASSHGPDGDREAARQRGGGGDGAPAAGGPQHRGGGRAERAADEVDRDVGGVQPAALVAGDGEQPRLVEDVEALDGDVECDDRDEQQDDGVPGAACDQER